LPGSRLLYVKTAGFLERLLRAKGKTKLRSLDALCGLCDEEIRNGKCRISSSRF
jgi:hypothetical protein